MESRTVTHDEFTEKHADHPAAIHREGTLKLEGTFESGVSVSHHDFDGKHGERAEARYPRESSEFIRSDTDGFQSRTLTQDEFGLKHAERLSPVRHESQFRVATDGRVT